MKVLCVAEKPSIAKSITEILAGDRWNTRNSPHQYIRNYDFSYRLPAPLGPAHGDTDFTVTAVLGHLMSSDFGEAHRSWHSCDPFVLFDAPVITGVDAKLKQVERNLQAEARHADLLMIWTDCDREGEHIGSEVAAVCKRVNQGLRVKRARFSAIIAAQIHQACRSANDLDMRMAHAVDTRIELDLKIGAAFTRLMTMSLQNRVPELSGQVISYGPCQFPTLGFVVDQYKRVQSFVPEKFWYIYVAIERPDEDDPDQVQTVEFKWKRNHLYGMEEAVVLYEACVEEPTATVVKVENKPTTKWKPLPLTTVEMQQSGSRLLGMAPKRVLDLAEKLYQKGFLSYPRTETDQYDKDFDFNSLIQKQTHDNTWGDYAQKLLDGAFQRPRNGKKNDKAHPPIHPTNCANNLEGDEKRVYELITRRFLASCSTNAEGRTTTVEAEIAGEFFSTSGLVISQRNYLEVYPYDKWSSNALPNFQEGEQFTPTVCELREGSTSPPKLLTEADLVGLMDKNGIGTDATIAEHIAKIIEREYVIERQDQRIKYLIPSSLGVGLVEGYNTIGFDRSLSKPHLRAETEQHMQDICNGDLTKQHVLQVSTEQYKEVYAKAKREFGTVVDCVINYLHGNGQDQAALRAAQRGRRGRGAAPARGARGARGGSARGQGRNNDENLDEGDEDDNDGDGPAPPRGGARGRGARGRGSTRGSTTTRGGSTRGGRGGARGGAAANDPRPPAAGRKRGANDNNDNGGDKRCNCPNQAVLRTVMKDGPRQGQKFWTCGKGKDEQCGFFEWAEEGVEQNSGPVAGPSRTTAPPAKKARTTAPPNRSNRDDGDPVRCECGLEAKSAVVNKDGPNKGRRFWACPNNPRAQCKFFEWNDDEEGRSGPTAPSGGGRAGFGGGAAGEAQDCYKCGQPGHWAKDCTSTDNNNNGGRSYNNQSSRGKKTASRGRGGASGGGGSSGSCFKCGESGHWANACPSGG